MSLHRVAECARAFSVNDAHGRQMRQISVVQILVKKRNGLVGRLADEIDLCGDGGGFAHLDLAGTGLLELLGARCGILFQKDQVVDVDQRAQNSHLHIQVAPGIRKGMNGAF